MNKKEAKERIEKLKRVINYHRYLYHVLDRQEISDSALDSLKKELFDLEQKFPEFITPDSPTQRVGGEPQKEFKKVRHSQPMLSFNDAFSKEDMIAWEERVKKLLSEEEAKKLTYFASYKIDGLAVSLVYKKGIFAKGATRGDGIVGEDVTQNLKTIESIPLKLERAVDCEVRGEVYMKKKDFEKLNEERIKRGEAPYSNPRNIAAGSIRQLDPKITASRKLNFIAWQLLGKKTKTEELRELKVLGFKPVEGKRCASLEEVFRYYEKVKNERDRIPYQIDGVVVVCDDNEIVKKLGVAGKAPRAAIAWKFPLKQATTIVEDIKVQVGRTGAVTPVAYLKPVEIEGVTVSRATLHNEDEIRRLGVKIGDTVIVGRAGDVIPDIVRVLKELRTGKEKEFKMPKHCPVCGTPLFRPRGEVVWRCPNPDCSARKRRNLYHFVSKKAFDIEGLGPKIIDQLIENNLISTPADIFELRKEDLLPLERFAEKSAKNLIDSISSKKRIPLSKFIYALGIPGVGEETAVLLAEEFGSLEKLKKASIQELQAIRDIGPETAESIYKFFREKRNLQLIEKLLKAGVEIEGPSKKKRQGKLTGKRIALTGTLASLTRESAKDKIRELGGEVTESISKNTDFLVVGENPGSKLDKAKKLGVKIIKEKEFLKLLS
jgi:DNA ligase (NAD+)